MRFIAILGAVLSLAPLTFAKPPVPRPAKELSIVEPSGKRIQLSSYKGKVVLMQFLYTTCPHCQATAKVFTKLQKDLGPRGLQVIGIAFNEEVEKTPEVVSSFVAANGVGFPVGIASRDAVMGYLGISVMSRFAVPMILIVDRKGVVRAQSDFMGSSELQDEAYLRPLLDGLLKEGATTVGRAR
jgi:peroxiredoxin